MFLYVKAFHIMAVITWMAGLFYFPRLLIYPIEAQTHQHHEIFKVMQHKLIKIIMNPAMIASWLAGITLISLNFDYYLSSPWFHVKFLCLLFMTHYHFMCLKWARQFKNGIEMKKGRHYRLMNEIPTLLMIIIVIMVVVKPSFS